MSMKSTSDIRPAIPAEIRRQVLIEAGHRCALPTCRHIEVDVHHIIPWTTCKKHEYENLIALCPNCHRRADRGDIDRKSLRIYKANLRFVHDKFSQLDFDVLFEAYKRNPEQPLLWPTFMRILIQRILDAEYVKCDEQETDVFAGNLALSPDHLYITDKGREFIDNIGTKEM